MLFDFIVCDPKTTMGKSYSKEEEIIIAQNGANQADYSAMESHMQLYGIGVILIVIIVSLIIMYKCCGKCSSYASTWLRKEMGNTIQTLQAQSQNV